MTGFMYKRCGHAVGQDTDQPYPVNVAGSRLWKRFWFELKQNELVYFPAAQRDRAAPIQRLALHEQALSAVDEGTGQFTLGSRWRSNNMRVESEAEAEAKSSTGSPRDLLQRVKKTGSDSRLGTASPPGGGWRGGPGSATALNKWTRALAVAIEQCQARTAHSGSSESGASRGLHMVPVPKSDEEVAAIGSFAENLWMKHDMARMMEGTNKELSEQIKEDMRTFIAGTAEGETPTLAEWAKVSVWAADTGGAKDSSGSAIRAQRGLWKRLFEQVLGEDSKNAEWLRKLEVEYADRVAGDEPKMVRSLCYDMGHVFDDEQDLANCIADMRAIGEGTVTEYAFKKWWVKHAKEIVMPHDYAPMTVDAIRSFKDFDESACGVLSRAQFLQLTRDLNWPDIEAWRTARVLSDERGHLSLRGFLALFNEKQLVHELMRVYDLDQDGLLEPAELRTLCAEWLGVDERGAQVLLQQYAAEPAAGLSAGELLGLVGAGVTAAKLPEGVPPSGGAEPEPEPEPEPEATVASMQMDPASPAAAALEAQVAAWVSSAEAVAEPETSRDKSASPTTDRDSGSPNPQRTVDFKGNKTTQVRLTFLQHLSAAAFSLMRSLARHFRVTLAAQHVRDRMPPLPPLRLVRAPPNASPGSSLMGTWSDPSDDWELDDEPPNGGNSWPKRNGEGRSVRLFIRQGGSKGAG